MLLYLSLALAVFSAIFSVLGVLRGERQDGRIPNAGRIAVLGAIVSATLAIGIELVRHQIQTDETRARLDAQTRQLSSQETLLTAQGQLLSSQADTLQAIKRSLFLFESLTLSVTVQIPKEELPPRVKALWDDYLKRIPPVRRGENANWVRDGGKTMVPRPLDILTVSQGSPLFPNRRLDGLALFIGGFDITISRKSDYVAEVATSSFWGPGNPPDFASLYFRVVGGERRITYNPLTGEVDLTAVFEHAVPLFEDGSIMSLLDLPNSSLVVLSDRHIGRCVEVRSVVLAFERGGSRIAGGNAAATMMNAVVGPVRCGGAWYRFKKTDFSVTREID